MILEKKLGITNQLINTSKREGDYFKEQNKEFKEFLVNKKLKAIYGKKLQTEFEILGKFQYIIKHYNNQGYELFGYIDHPKIQGEWLYFVGNNTILIYSSFFEIIRKVRIDHLMDIYLWNIYKENLDKQHKKCIEAFKKNEVDCKTTPAIKDMIKNDYKILNFQKYEKLWLVSMLRPVDLKENKGVLYSAFDLLIKENKELPISQGNFGFWPISLTIIEKFPLINKINLINISNEILAAERERLNKEKDPNKKMQIEKEIEIMEKERTKDIYKNIKDMKKKIKEIKERRKE